ncbi:MBL fold metallo-hydrolase [uncultured Thiodictyon sp.]|uniref:MBL fold metallo-hydrolase n=1 Tax=uncultured Thiodictyon sp. TaxID=1846217 RepID=UPI0025FD8EA6|nr:MBL fold metallo-hydrolase [uncultured Thiodictyon sp.]
MKSDNERGSTIGRRSVLKGVGALTLAPLLLGLGGDKGYTLSPAVDADRDMAKYRTRLVLLGTTGGMTWWPGSKRASASQVLMVGDAIYIIDLGFGSLARLAEAFNFGQFITYEGHPMQLELSSFLTNLRAVFFTHMHMDHLGDYPTFLEIGARAGFGSKEKLPIIGPGNRGRLEENHSGYTGTIIEAQSRDPALVTPSPGIKRTTELLLQAFATTFNDSARDEGYPDIPKIIDVREIGDPKVIPWPPGFKVPDPGKPWSRDDTCPAMEPFEIYRDNLVKVSAILVDHYQLYPTFALRFDTADGSLVISSDTGPDTKGNLQKLAKGADVLVHEVIDEAWVDVAFKGVKEGDPAYALYHHALTAHTPIKDVGKVAEQCGAKTLVLSHIGPANTPMARLKEAQQGFSGKLIIGEDLLQVGVGKPRG